MKTKICAVGDSHWDAGFFDLIRDIDVDIFIHTGDLLGHGSITEYILFLDEISHIKARHKILLPGNHDWVLEKDFNLCKGLLPKNVHLLLDSGVTIRGIKFYGTPWTNPFMDWAFMLPEKDQEKKFSLIPKNTDVLICHGPPYGILDTVRRRQQEFPSNTYYEKLGSHALAKALGRVRPKVAAWGHIHDAYGQKTIGETTYINASLLDEGYNLVNKPVIFEL